MAKRKQQEPAVLFKTNPSWPFGRLATPVRPLKVDPTAGLPAAKF